MRRKSSAGEQVYISMNSAGQLIITSAEEHRKQIAAAGPVVEKLSDAPISAGKLDSAGRLRLPKDVLTYLRSASSIDSPSR